MIVDYTSVTFVISVMGVRGMIFFFSNGHSMADVSTFNGGPGVCCPKDCVFYFNWD